MFWNIIAPLAGGLVKSLFGGSEKKAKEPKTYQPVNITSPQIEDDKISKQIAQSKELAQYKLGLDQNNASFMGGLREKEFASQFGRQTSFEDQQQRGRVDLTNITQNALTGRLNSELSNRLTQQQKGFDQSNLQTNRAIGLASKRLGR